jgi:FdhD protein
MSDVKIDTAEHSAERQQADEYRVVKIAPTSSSQGTRTLANEVAVAMEFDGQPYAVMMLTPADFEDFAVGFALSERIVENASDIARIDVREGTRGIAVDVRLEKEHTQRLIERRRAIAGQSGCGICGLTTIEEALPELPPLTRAPKVTPKALFAALAALPARQTLNQATGAVHAAAFCTPDGSIVAVREDVGRHNAFDKVVGWAFVNGRLPLADALLCVSGRISFELVQKAAVAGCPLLVAVGAPSSLAVELARDRGVTLCGFVRGGRLNVYTEPWRIEA